MISSRARDANGCVNCSQPSIWGCLGVLTGVSTTQRMQYSKSVAQRVELHGFALCAVVGQQALDSTQIEEVLE